MLNAYVHLDVLGLPGDVLYDDDVLDALWAALPDAGVGGGAGHPLGLTLSQFALTDRAAARRQTARMQRALAAIGRLDATVRVAEVAREGARDDIAVAAATIRWRACALTGRLRRL